MIINGNSWRPKDKKTGIILLEALVALAVFGIFVSSFLSALNLVSGSSQLTVLASSSMLNAVDGAAKVAACPFDKIVVSGWAAESYELQIPIVSERFFSTNYYKITTNGMTKLIEIQNVFDYHGRKITNTIYHFAAEI